MMSKNEMSTYYNGYGLNKIKPLNKNTSKIYLIKPKFEEEQGRKLVYPYFPFLSK